MLRFCHPFLIFQPGHAPCRVDNSGSLFCSISYIDTFTHISQPLHGLFISPRDNLRMRCDLHVHTKASGMCNTAFVRQFCRESYNDAEAVYDCCKRLGMSAVTVTDHDSIDAAELLHDRPDFFLSEEVTCSLPSGTELHLGVYGISERDHIEIQKRRADFISLLMYLTERKIFYSVNHVFSGLTGRRKLEDFEWFASYALALETRNGQMWSRANEEAERLAVSYGKIGIAGSDSHTLAGVARTYTEVPGARTVWGLLDRRAHRWMRRLKRRGAPGWIRYWMLTATRLGDGWIWYSTALLLLLFAGPQRFAAVSSAALAAIIGVIVFKALKRLSQRPRPCQIEPHCWSKVLPPDKFSFPSGHTMTASSVALVLTYFYPSLEIALIFLALSIALSRIVLGMHFLSDVLAGIVLGVALGCCALTTYASLGFL